jgi:hypothetical protein
LITIISNERKIEMTETKQAPNTDDEVRRMPWTRHLMTPEQVTEWMASRKQAGVGINIETCELGHWGGYEASPYDIREGDSDLDPEMRQIGTNRFVRSPTSNGWVSECDLPHDSGKAMYARIEREWEAAHPDDAARLKATLALDADDDNVPF